jgi:hypothetical protein
MVGPPLFRSRVILFQARLAHLAALFLWYFPARDAQALVIKTVTPGILWDAFLLQQRARPVTARLATLAALARRVGATQNAQALGLPSQPPLACGQVFAQAIALPVLKQPLLNNSCNEPTHGPLVRHVL